ncbi:Sensor protein KdpD [Microbulbifer aggregans]|uniref:histidine kinase n=1 Tax=Microbulbifer aggregans TaxID=1769779 RepID=A0A1C9W6U2_9GAMM|nr:ATP-binding protein [Microbulbifer aggregans]AOS96873.1 Sensor protein KdpD [Microbulbifer aggregans]
MRLRRQLLLVSLVTLAMPWAGCQYLRQVDEALADGQVQALEATASAVAARLASAPQLILPDPERQHRPPGAQLYLNPLPQAPLVDGYGDEWRQWSLAPQQLVDADGQPMARATLGLSGERIYLLLTVSDDTPSHHDPRTGLRASGDAVEIQTGGRHYTLPVASQGPTVALWHNRQRGGVDRELRLRGRWTSSANGYQLELSLPHVLTDGEMAITVLDRRHSNGGTPSRLASTLPGDGIPGRLVQPLRALQTELEHFDRQGLRLAVVDSEGYLLASSGTIQTQRPAGAEQSWLQSWAYRKLLNRGDLPALPDDGLPVFQANLRVPSIHWFRAPRDGRIAAASVPVITRADAIVERPLLGRVIALQSGDSVLALTESAAHRLWLLSATAAGAAALLLLGYASWLSWRVRRLHRAATNAIDGSGRLRGDFPRARLGDELGDLNRAFADLLAELDRYHHYLRTLASKLSHELRTPLAVVRSSLDNLSMAELPADSRRYAERAQEGSARLSGILNSLSAASDLEASIRHAERESFDLADLLQALLQCYGDAHPTQQFLLDCPDAPLPCHGAPELLAQLMDKLVDNAVSFAPAGSEIRVHARCQGDTYWIQVENEGPLLPEGFDRKLFDSLVSVRGDGDRGGHLGLGLYIARLIAEFHGGRLTAANRKDNKGAVFTLLLPNGLTGNGQTAASPGSG